MKKILSIALVVALLPLTTLTALASTIQVVIAHDGPASSDIAVGARDVILNKMTITADGDVVVDNLTVTVNANGEGLLDDSGVENFTDFKIVRLDSSGAIGDTLMGPSEVSSSGSDSSQTLNFTDDWDIDAHTTVTIAVTCDVAHNSLLEGSTISADLEPVSTTSGILDVISGDYVTDIIPSVPIFGYVMTVIAPSLSVNLASTPISDTVVGGAHDVNVVSFALTAGSSSDVTITELVLSGYIDENSDLDYNQGVDNSVDIHDVVTNVWLEDIDGNVIAGPEVLSSSGEATFSDTWDIPAGETQSVKVYADISGSAPYNLDDDAVYFDIDDVSSDIVAEDEEGNVIVPFGDDANGSEDSPRVVVTITDAGTLTLFENSSSGLDDQVISAGSEDVLVGSFKIEATDEAFEVNKMTVTVSEPNAIESLTIEYPTNVEYPEDLDGSASAAVAGSSALFSGISAMVPKDEYIVVNLYADFAEHVADGGSLDSGDALIFVLDTTGYDFEAVGVDSGEVMDETDVSDVTASNVTYVYRSVPTFTSSTAIGSSLIFGDDQEIYRFSVSADDNGDILLKSFAFDVSTTGVRIPVGSFYVTEYGHSTVLGTGLYISADGVVAIRLSSSATIAAASSKTYSLYADVYDRNPRLSNEVVSVRIHQDAYTAMGTFADVRTALGGYGTIWSDLAGGDWIGNYATPGMPVSYIVLN